MNSFRRNLNNPNVFFLISLNVVQYDCFNANVPIFNPFESKYLNLHPAFIHSAEKKHHAQNAQHLIFAKILYNKF